MNSPFENQMHKNFIFSCLIEFLKKNHIDNYSDFLVNYSYILSLDKNNFSAVLRVFNKFFDVCDD